MSRSNNETTVNPCSRFFEWSGEDGNVKYYDKDSKTNIIVEMPFCFLVLDRLAQVGGGVDSANGWIGYWSNAVRNLSIDTIIVRSKAGEVCKGTYSEIKTHSGVKFITGLYIAYYENGKLSLGHLKLQGSSLSAWIEFTKQHKNIMRGKFSFVDKLAKKKGSNNYFEPVFGFDDEVSDNDDHEAIEIDKALQIYLSSYLKGNKKEEVDSTFKEIESEFDEDIPF